MQTIQQLEVYQEGRELKENEYLLKVRGGWREELPAGFMTKFTQKGHIPIAFKIWNEHWLHKNIQPLTIYIIKEKLRTGWRIHDYRSGKSQSWAVLVHPLGFTVEVHMDKFIKLLAYVDVSNGEILQPVRWEYSKLVVGIDQPPQVTENYNKHTI